MRKKFLSLGCMLLLCAGLSGLCGCGKTGGGEPASGSMKDVSSEKEEQAAAEASATPEASEQAGTDASGKEQGKTGSTERTDKKDSKDSKADLKREKKLARLEKERYQDSSRMVRVLGLKTYKELKSDRYEDHAKKGKVFLVLFLEIRNDGLETEYFNPYQLSAKIDGKAIEHTVLWNEPEGYPTIFSNVEAGSGYAGFVVWEVPEKWKKLHVEYKGFKLESGDLLEMDLSRKNIVAPEKYSLTSYGAE